MFSIFLFSILLSSLAFSADCAAGYGLRYSSNTAFMRETTSGCCR
jgi:hypothetical protein